MPARILGYYISRCDFLLIILAVNIDRLQSFGDLNLSYGKQPNLHCGKSSHQLHFQQLHYGTKPWQLRRKPLLLLRSVLEQQNVPSVLIIQHVSNKRQ